MDLGAVLQARFSKNARQNCVKSAPEIADFGGEKLNTTGSRELKINTPNHRISGQSCPKCWLDFGGLLWHFSAKNLHFTGFFAFCCFGVPKGVGKSMVSGGVLQRAFPTKFAKICFRNRRFRGGRGSTPQIQERKISTPETIGFQGRVAQISGLIFGGRD